MAKSIVILACISLLAGIPCSAGAMTYLEITPAEDFEFIGKVGGPFFPSSRNYNLKNISDSNSLYWSVEETADWLDVGPETEGYLDPNESIITLSLNSGANLFEEGLYIEIITFHDLTNDEQETRSVSLQVLPYGAIFVPLQYSTIQSAINDANDGDIVIVVDGTYTGTGNRDIDFLGKAITVKSANGRENCIMDCQGSYSEPHRGFYFHNGEDSNSVLDGFTIINGDSRYGDGITCDGSNPTITNCKIMQYPGHGIWCDSSPIIKNCVVKGSADCGSSGITCYGGSPSIINCVISNNQGCLVYFGAGGGGLYFYQSDAFVSGSIITNNWEYGLYEPWDGQEVPESGGGIKIVSNSCTV